jgi:hypothetical protein
VLVIGAQLAEQLAKSLALAITEPPLNGLPCHLEVTASQLNDFMELARDSGGHM